MYALTVSTAMLSSRWRSRSCQAPITMRGLPPSAHDSVVLARRATRRGRKTAIIPILTLL